MLPELKRCLNLFRNYSKTKLIFLIGLLLSSSVFSVVLIGHSCVESQGESNATWIETMSQFVRNCSQSKCEGFDWFAFLPLGVLGVPDRSFVCRITWGIQCRLNWNDISIGLETIANHKCEGFDWFAFLPLGVLGVPDRSFVCVESHGESNAVWIDTISQLV